MPVGLGVLFAITLGKCIVREKALINELKCGVDLISDVLPFSGLVLQPFKYAQFVARIRTEG